MLVVDDDEVIRRLIAVNLQLEGFDVETAVDGQDCLNKVTEIDPDVITLDVMMPRLDGWETAVQLRKSPETAHIKVVLITARAQEDDKTKGSDVGADAYLTKPFDPNEMIRVVRELAGSGLGDHRRAPARHPRRGRPARRRPAAPAGPGAGELRVQPPVPPGPERPGPARGGRGPSRRARPRALDRRRRGHWARVPHRDRHPRRAGRPGGADRPGGPGLRGKRRAARPYRTRPDPRTAWSAGRRAGLGAGAGGPRRPADGPARRRGGRNPHF